MHLPFPVRWPPARQAAAQPESGAYPRVLRQSSTRYEEAPSDRNWTEAIAHVQKDTAVLPAAPQPPRHPLLRQALVLVAEIEPGGQHQLHVVRLGCAGRSETRHQLKAWIAPGHALARMRHQIQRHRRVVQQPRTYSRPIEDGRDANAVRSSAGPISDRKRIAADPIEPAASTHCRASTFSPETRRTPTTRRSSNSRQSTVAFGRIIKFVRSRAG